MVQRKADAVRIWIRNRDLKSRSRRLLRPKRQSVTFTLDHGATVTVKLTDSFWRSCSEFRDANIGRWLLDQGLAPWPKGPRDLDDSNGRTERQPWAPLQPPCTNTKVAMTLIVLAVLGICLRVISKNGMPFLGAAAVLRV